MADPDISAEEAALIEGKMKERFDYVLECFDRARAEGTTTLQWHFGTITGGIGLAVELFSRSHYCLGSGILVVVGAAMIFGFRLLKALKFQPMEGPGTHATDMQKAMETRSVLKARVDDAIASEAQSKRNEEKVAALATAVDTARRQLAYLPLFFIGGSFAVEFLRLLYRLVLIPIAHSACF